MKPQIQAFFDDATWTVSYVVFDEPGGHCALVDSVLDYDAKSGRTRTHSADRLVAFVQSKGLTVQWILETHAHADHLSAAHYLRSKLGGKIAIGAAITQVQEVFKAIFHLEPEFHPDGRQFDHLLHDEEVFTIGQLEAKALAVPGHTPACMAYQIADAVLVGDTLFMPDVGTARCDFPGGNAHTLYQSVRKLLSLPAQTRLFMCHDYPRRARPGLADHGRRSARPQHPCARRRDRSGIRRTAHPARCNAGHARSHPAVGAGQHQGRGDAPGRRQRRDLSQDSRERAVTRYPRATSSEDSGDFHEQRTDHR